MLTDEKLRRTEKLIGYFLIEASETLRSDFQEVFTELRTIQQQNTQLIDSIDNIVHAFDWDNGEVRNYLSGEPLEKKAQERIKEADKLIQSIQGGPNGTSNHNA